MKSLAVCLAALMAIAATGGLVLAIAPAHPVSETAVNYCVLDEYCSEMLLTPDRAKECRTEARGQALRIKAGIPAPCLKEIDDR